MKRNAIALGCLALIGATVLTAQPPPAPEMKHRRPGDSRSFDDRRRSHGPPHGLKGHGSSRGPQGRFWVDPRIAERLSLTGDQRAKMDEIYQSSRLKLIDLNASLQKEQATLEPMLEAERPDQSKVLEQIDRVAQARAELEKSNARMLLGFRGVLSVEQWKKLNERPAPAPRPSPAQPKPISL